MPRTERPLERDGSLLTQFAGDLRRLREKAGRPSYRALARRAHFSSTALSDAAGGRTVPSLAVTLAYVRTCGGNVEEWEDRWRALVAESIQTEKTIGVEVDCGQAPYRGLAPYQADDGEWFFGRERLVDELVARVDAQRFVAVLGHPARASRHCCARV